jgi:hypothetical protein
MAKEKVEAKTEALANWDQELANAAKLAADMEANAGGGQFFSTRAGVLTWQGAALPGGQMGVVILDHILENKFYEGDFDADNPESPSCYAFGRDELKLAPHKLVVEAGTAKHETCKGCPQNEWGSADKGKGKACSNRRRIAMISAGEFGKDGKFIPIEAPEHYQTAQVGYFGLSPTGLKGFAQYVKQLAAALKRPPFGVFTLVKVAPDPKKQISVSFSALGTVPNELLAAISARAKEAKELIEFPYQLGGEETAPAKGKQEKQSRQPPSKGGQSRY